MRLSLCRYQRGERREARCSIGLSPLYITALGARVARQRCPILRTGRDNLSHTIAPIKLPAGIRNAIKNPENSGGILLISAAQLSLMSSRFPWNRAGATGSPFTIHRSLFTICRVANGKSQTVHRRSEGPSYNKEGLSYGRENEALGLSSLCCAGVW